MIFIKTDFMKDMFNVLHAYPVCLLKNWSCIELLYNNFILLYDEDEMENIFLVHSIYLTAQITVTSSFNVRFYIKNIRMNSWK